MSFFSTWGVLVLSAGCNAYAAYVVKGRFNELGPIDFSSFKKLIAYLVKFSINLKLASGVITYILAPLLWFVALDRLDVTAAYPIAIACQFIFVFFFGIVFLKEELNIYKVFGCLAIIASFFLFSQ